MGEALTIAGVALTAFVSTNFDNLLLLISLQTRAQPRLPVFIGYVGAMLLFAALGLLTAQLADQVSSLEWGYLGIVPLAMGLYRFVQALRWSSRGAEISAAVSTVGIVGVATLTIANGADTLGALLPLFAETQQPLTYVLAGTVVLAAAFWVALSGWISGHPWVRLNLERAERWLVPVMLIVVGFYILLNSATDTVPGESLSIGAPDS